MIIGDRLRLMREEKRFSQGEIEERTGLLRCHISRVENGHTIPSIETLEKVARLLKFLSTNFSTTVKSRQPSRIFPSGRLPTTLSGAVLGRSAVTGFGSVNNWARWMQVTGSCFSFSLRR